MRKLVLVLVILFFGSPVQADELSDIKEMMKHMQEDIQIKMDTMQQRIDQIEREKNLQSSRDKQEIEQLRNRIVELEGSDQKEIKSTKSLLSTLNPEVSIIGDLIYKATDEDDGEGDNDFNLREVELAFSANVDTYARGDIIIAIENEDGSIEVQVEEGYLTLLETPIENLQGKFGKFRPFMGKANKMHLHQLPWTDYPLVTRRFLGEEGFSDAGVSLSYLIPNPLDIYSELTVEAFNNGTNVFGGGEEGETVYLTHWKTFFDITDDSTLEVGGSYAFGENGAGDGAETQVSGFDLTLVSELFNNRKTTSHTEALFNTREQASGDDVNSWGLFTSLEQQLTDRWWAFGRYDFSQTATASEVDTNAYSAGFTFAQSEYVFWRTMYTHTNNENSDDVDTVWIQLEFSIGPHKPHDYR